jgi:hypothetical protein
MQGAGNGTRLPQRSRQKINGSSYHATVKQRSGTNAHGSIPAERTAAESSWVLHLRKTDLRTVIGKKARQQLLLCVTFFSGRFWPVKKKLEIGKDFYCEKKANVLPSFLWIWKL